ncbi:MAG: 3-dehydroquinate synthase [Bacteroidota bacterium]|nr:3-dehydroquinate synthase [Bacteroidota bacterium]
MKTFNLKTPNSRIYISENVFSEIKKFLKSSNYSNEKIFILVDENTIQNCLPVLINEVEELNKAEIIEIESGEENKTIDICIQLWESLSELNANRKSLLVNLGGGVIGDMGGFIASTFKRGMNFINIPTTLLSMVDASVGGKTGVDLNNIKNIIGVFNEPRAVFINPSFLNTLSQRQLLSGFAEILKHGLIADKNYWNLITSSNPDFHNPEYMSDLIYRSVEIKNDIVLKDPLEKDLRKILNFGHTIGHAIETLSLEKDKDPLLHGESVAIGLICESFLSVKYTNLDEAALYSISSSIKSLYKHYPINKNLYNKLTDIMKKDKKNENQKINFTLLKGIGNAEININCNINDIHQSLDYYNKL